MPADSSSSFDLGYWIFNHKRQVHLANIGILVLANVIIWGINARFGFMYLANRQVDADVQAGFLATDILFSSIATPKPIQIASVQAMRHDSTHIDVVALIKNPNQVFASHQVVGQFVVGGEPQPPVSFFVNANEIFYLPQLSVESTELDPAVTFSILSVDWFRLHGEVSQEHWEITDVTYTSLAFADKNIDLRRQVTATITNRSAFGFKQARITVVLLLDSQVVGVASTVTDVFAALSSKPYTFTWSQDLPLSATPEIQIHIDRSDPNQILSP